MAEIDDLISQVGDAHLRSELLDAANALRANKKFGLVYERHLPETIHLPVEGRVAVGAQVVVRTEPDNETQYVVESTNRSHATLTDGGTTRKVRHRDLLIIKPFGEPVFPVLRPYGSPVVRGGDKPFHTVINGENFHALQLLLFGYEGKVDCIYIDPPYNTGARDWKYNNDFVDEIDTYRHSKWLSFMEKRLRLAKRLLKDDGVLVVTIDEHEMFRLGVLLRELFPESLIYPVSVVINSRGSTGTRNFGVIEEYALFVVPDTGTDLVSPRERMIPGLSSEASSIPEEGEDDDEGEDTPDKGYWTTAYRTGQGTSFRTQRPKQFYPIFIDAETKLPVGVGKPLLPKTKGGDLPKPTRRAPKGQIAIWPIDTDGEERAWAFEPGRMAREIANGNFRVGRYYPKRKTYATSVRRYKQLGDERFRERTIWWEKSYDAGANGTSLLKQLLGQSGRFPFPKSVFAVRDTLATIVCDRPDAVIVDFFCGSGTTVHATAMLNALDGGHRRCIAVTNNEVDEKTAGKLNAGGHYRGDDDFEAAGIFRNATVPRVEAAITGTRSDGKPVPGKYKWQENRRRADGFDENAAFLTLTYADPDAIETGTRFEDVLPALWLAAGAVGDITQMKATAEWFLDPAANFAVLLDEDRFAAFRKEVAAREDIGHVWLVTNSTSSFARMSSKLPGGIQAGMLYRDYLRNFRLNTGDAV